MLCYHVYFYREKIKCKLDRLIAVEFTFKAFTVRLEIITEFLEVILYIMKSCLYIISPERQME